MTSALARLWSSLRTSSGCWLGLWFTSSGGLTATGW
jgi:hypothetical protein